MANNGTQRVISALKAQSLKGMKKIDAKVMYETTYAIFVHENLQVYHPVGSAKYLEIPTRLLMPEMKKVIEQTVKNKKSLESGVIKAATILLNASRELVPVDTGDLRRSGRIEISGSDTV